MPGKLTTHVLDTASGKPAVGMRIELHRLEAGKKIPVADRITNKDGRTDEPMLPEISPGHYRLLFHVGDYFALQNSQDTGQFLEVVPVLFHITDGSKGCHVPLLVSPYAYSTYRGS